VKLWTKEEICVRFAVTPHTAEDMAMLSEVRVSYTQALQFHDSEPDNWGGYWVTYGRDMQDKGMVQALGWMEPEGGGFITLFRTVHGLKLMNCSFLEFFI